MDTRSQSWLISSIAEKHFPRQRRKKSKEIMTNLNRYALTECEMRAYT